MKKIFKDNIKLVEIETFSYCNRQCWHCPNCIIDRHSGNTYMSDFVFEKIMKNLKQIQYNGLISFSRYNEPLADTIIYKRLKQVRQTLPNAQISINTNGDFLFPETLSKLEECGLNLLNVQVYSQDNKDIDQKINNKLLSLGYNDPLLTIDTSYMKKYRVFYKEMRIEIYWRDFNLTGVNRGGIIGKLNRKPIRIAPCITPTKGIYIDYNGCIMPCCNMRSDWEEHKKFIMGNLNDKNRNLFNIYCDKKATQFRNLMNSEENKPYPCNLCHFTEDSKWTK